MYEMREKDEGGGRGIKCEYSSQRSGEREGGREERKRRVLFGTGCLPSMFFPSKMEGSQRDEPPCRRK